MTAMTWTEQFQILADNFKPLTALDGHHNYPSLKQAPDDGMERLLANYLASGGSRVNKRFVESLLSDCVTRISNSLTLRERAYDIEVHAIGEAMNHKLQIELSTANQAITELLAPLQASMGGNAIGLKAHDDGFTFTGDQDLWTKIQQYQKDIFEAQQANLLAISTKASTPGNGANYLERFAMVKNLFDLGMPELYGRCLACALALKKIYRIEVSVPAVTPTGYLNDLAVWAQTASDKLDSELSERYTADVMLAVASMDETLKGCELLERSKYS